MSIIVVKEEKVIHVDPPESSISVIQAGPPGFIGPAGIQGPPGALTGYAIESELSAQMDPLDTRLDAVELARTRTSWVNLTLLNSWLAYGGGYVTPRYRKVNGIVYIEGLLAVATLIGNHIATLPVGFRPPASVLFPVHTGEPWGLGRIDVYSDGRIVRESGNTNYVSISGIKFGAA